MSELRVWEKLDKAELHGSFIKLAMNGGKPEVVMTCDTGSSVDVLAKNMGSSTIQTQKSYRYRSFIYRRIKLENGRQKVVVWDAQGNAVISKFAFDEVFYLPFHKCFLGFVENLTFMFHQDISKEDEWILYANPCLKVFVFGTFIMYSDDGKLFGLLDGETHNKVEPFFEFMGPNTPWELPLFHTWTDEFFPVSINKRAYIMDTHGTCYCEVSNSITRYTNVFRSGDILFGLDQEHGGIVQLQIPYYVSELLSVEDELVVRSDFRYYYPNAYGDMTRVTPEQYNSGKYRWEFLGYQMFSYYGEIVKKASVNSYFRTPLTLPFNTGGIASETLKNSCFVIQSHGGKYGLFNEETNKALTELIYDEVCCCGDGFRLTYGDSYIYLNELGNFVEERKKWEVVSGIKVKGKPVEDKGYKKDDDEEIHDSLKDVLDQIPNWV